MSFIEFIESVFLCKETDMFITICARCAIHRSSYNLERRYVSS